MLLEKESVCQEIERALAGWQGVERFRTSQWSCSAVVYYDAGRIGKQEVLRILADALKNAYGNSGQTLAVVPGRKPLKGAKGIAMIFIGLGIFGVLVPGIPGWPFLLVAIPLYSAGSPGESKFDAWLKRRFPTARRKGLELTLKMLRGGGDAPSRP